MRLFPRHRFLRWLAVSWLLAACVMLGLMLLRPELQGDERRALSGLVPLYFLSFPLGHAGLMACNKLKLELFLDSGFVPAIYTEGMVLWIVLTVLGYAQWFVLLPWISRKCRQLHRFLFRRDPAG
jgi:hypothetical protein